MPNEISRIVSNGFFVTQDGGETWTAGITPVGINASLITTGELDTAKVRIIGGQGQEAFYWDEYGINAYDGGNKENFIRFDKFGLYGMVNQKTLFKPESLSEVIDNSLFSLTKSGLKFNTLEKKEGETTKLVSIFDLAIDDEQQAKLFIKGEIIATSLTIIGNNNEENSFENAVKGLVDIPGSVLTNVKTEGNTTTFTYKDNTTAQIINYNKNIVFSNVGFGYGKGLTIDKNNKVTGEGVAVSTKGLLIANNAIIGGIIYAGGGQIGNWTLEKNHKSTNGPSVLFSDGTGMASRALDEDPAFWAGFTTNSTIKTPWYENDWRNKTKFYVTNSGKLYAKDSVIDGTINASTGHIGGENINGTWSGGWTINKNYISSVSSDNKIVGLQAHNGGAVTAFSVGGTNNSDWTQAPFYVKFDGSLYASKATIEGTIKANAGNIGGCEIVDGELTIDGGRITTGTISAERIDTDNLTISSTKVNGLTNKIQTTTIDGGQIKTGYIDAERIGTGTLYADDGIYIGSSTNGWQITQDSLKGRKISYNVDGINGSVKERVYIDPRYISVDYKMGNNDVETNYSARWSDVLFVAKNARTLSNDSDIAVKNSISSYSDAYEKFFDNIKPCRYKYNFGTSDRYHTGFIAQEIVVALETAGLTTQEFAGVIKLEEPNMHGSEWLLRRDEFVSLNTWQIQKLKTRTTELENEILNLKKEIENLKSSQNSAII
jgi:hypothetical protein